MRVGSLFSGIGGIDLGFERAGWEIAWQVERDDWCRRVLAKHWPTVPRYDDVTTLTGAELDPVDVLCGGFPCQPVSTAGIQKGTSDDRWLWPHFYRLICVLRPRYVFVENVPGLFTANGGDAFADVVGNLAQARYDCEWSIVSARDVGAPHLRKRLWIVATDADGVGRVGDRTDECERQREEMGGRELLGRNGGDRVVADAQIRSEGGNLTRPHRGTEDSSSGDRHDLRDRSRDRGETLADAHGERLEGEWPDRDSEGREGSSSGSTGLCGGAGSGVMADANRAGRSGDANDNGEGEPHLAGGRGRGVGVRQSATLADAECGKNHRERGIDRRKRKFMDGARQTTQCQDRQASSDSVDGCRQTLADATVAGREARRTNGMGDADGPRRDEGQSSGTHRQGARIFRTPFSGEWEPEPELGRVANGIPSRVDRLRGLGNAVVPQIVTEIARRLAEEIQDAL